MSANGTPSQQFSPPLGYHDHQRPKAPLFIEAGTMKTVVKYLVKSSSEPQFSGLIFGCKLGTDHFLKIGIYDIYIRSDGGTTRRFTLSIAGNFEDWLPKKVRSVKMNIGYPEILWLIIMLSKRPFWDIYAILHFGTNQ